MSRRALRLLLQRTLNLVNLKQIHAQASTLGLLDADQPLACKLFDTYAKLGHTRDAYKVFDNIPEPDIVSYTSLINLHLQTHRPDKAFLVFFGLISVGLRPDSFMLVAALSACGRNRDSVNGKIVHGMVLQHDLDLVPIVGNALIDMYCRNGEVESAQWVFKHMGVKNVGAWTSLLNGFVLCNDLEAARKLFDEMPQRNDVAWNAMITGYVKGKMPVQALEVFKQMKVEGENLITAITIVAAISGCTDIGALDHAQSIHGNIVKVRLDNNTHVGNALMDMYSKAGCPDSAVKVLHALDHKDVFSWTTIVSCYAFHGKGNEALKIFHNMLASGVVPNDISVLAVLSACSHGRLVAEAQMVFHEMIRLYGFEPKIEHYGCMVDLLGRAGLLEEAKAFIEKMPIDPDVVVWRSLLGACVVHGNLELAEMAGRKIIQLKPDDDGAYVLLWNIYFNSDRKEDARLIRKMMTDRMVKKRPAWSSVEVNGVAHEFVAEGSSHHASADVYSVLKRFSGHLNSDSDTFDLDLD